MQRQIPGRKLMPIFCRECDGTGQKSANGQGFEFAAIVKNTGKTAATNVHGSFTMGFFGNDMLAAVPKDRGNKCSVGLLVAGCPLMRTGENELQQRPG